MRTQQLSKYVNHIAWTVIWSVRYYASPKISYVSHNALESLLPAKMTVHVEQIAQQDVLVVPLGNAGKENKFVLL